MNVCVAEIYELRANGGSWREARDTPADIEYSARSIRWRQRYSRASNVIARISDCRCFD